MKNLKTTLALVIAYWILSVANVHADVIGPGVVPGTSSRGSTLIIGSGIAVGAVALISWLVIRAIRKKKNVIK